MSELTKCNFCSLAQIRADAEARDRVVSTRPSGQGGVDVYVHPPGREPRTTDPDLDPESDFVAWLMRLTDECAC